MAMKSFEEAEKQIAGLMAAIGGNVNAYEDEPPFVPQADPTPAPLSYEQAKLRTEEAMRAIPVPDQAPTPSPFEETEVIQGEEPTSEEEKAFFDEMGIDPNDPCFDDAFWEDVTEMVVLPQIPNPVEEDFQYEESVHRSKELAAIYRAFQEAKDVPEGHPLPYVGLEEGTYQIRLGPQGFTLADILKGRIYQQQTSHPVGSSYDQVEENDLFIWVLHDDDEEEPVGYIHNEWVFLRK
jgi:hypothetical protein